MTYEEWNSEQDWWKSGAEETFKEWWVVLDENSCWHGDDIAMMFDDLKGAMASEYGN